MNIISKYRQSFYEIKKKTGNDSVFIISFFNSIAISYLISFKLSYYSWLALENYPTGDTIWRLSEHLPLLYFLIFGVLALPTITKGMIYLNNFISKFVFFGIITKLDMFYFKRYRKHSPISEIIFNTQLKLASLDPKLKTKILTLTIILAIAFYAFRALETFQFNEVFTI